MILQRIRQRKWFSYVMGTRDTKTVVTVFHDGDDRSRLPCSAAKIESRPQGFPLRGWTPHPLHPPDPAFR
jgi:hypothetical protein